MHLRQRVRQQCASVRRSAEQLKSEFHALPRQTKVLSISASVLCVAGAAVFLRYAGLARGRRLYAYFLLGRNFAKTIADFAENHKRKNSVENSKISAVSSESHKTEI